MILRPFATSKYSLSILATFEDFKSKDVSRLQLKRSENSRHLYATGKALLAP